jgi:hypothetical protein
LTNRKLNIYLYIKELPFIKGNSSSVNILIFLLVAAYFIVGHDLSKEMAKAKNEIGFFTSTLENSVHVDTTDILTLLEMIPPGMYIIPPTSPEIINSDVQLFPPGRSPPL